MRVASSDVMSGWTSGRGILHKIEELVVKQLSVIKENLPFAMNSLFFDNGIEFIKHLLVEKFKIKYGLDVARAAYSKYEDCEERGSIRLATLAKAAEAMDCELVYAIRPKSKKYFSNIILGKLLPQSQLHP